jgi:phosphatidylglycerol:prolipoprotein diacylglycerol transferase
MMPVLLQLGPLKIHTYGFLMAVAFLAAAFLYNRDMRRYLAPRMGLTPEQGLQKVLDLVTLLIPLVIVGGRSWYVIEYWGEFKEDPVTALYLWDGGLVYYGGLLVSLAGCFWWMRREKWPVALAFDLAAPWFALGHAIGRIGCFSSGCCYGRLCDPAHGVVFPNLDGLPHYPTQLWEAAGNLAICLVLFLLRRWVLKFPWMTISLYGVLYGLLRFNMEFWRWEPGSPRFGAFVSHSQAVSALFVAAGLVGALAILLRSRKGPVSV